MTNLITVAELAEFAPDLDTSSFSTTTISGMIARATKAIASFCSVKGFDYGSYTDTDRALISGDGDLVISAKARPVQSVTSITLKRGGFSTSLILNDNNGLPIYQIPDPGNRIHVPNSYLYLTGTYLAGGQSQMIALKYAKMFCTTVWVGGYQTIPDDLKDACSLWVQDIVMRRINRAGLTNFSQGSLSMGFNSGSDSNGDSNVIKEAKTILRQGDYVRPEVF